MRGQLLRLVLADGDDGVSHLQRPPVHHLPDADVPPLRAHGLDPDPPSEPPSDPRTNHCTPINQSVMTYLRQLAPQVVSGCVAVHVTQQVILEDSKKQEVTSPGEVITSKLCSFYRTWLVCLFVRFQTPRIRRFSDSLFDFFLHIYTPTVTALSMLPGLFFFSFFQTLFFQDL